MRRTAPLLAGAALALVASASRPATAQSPPLASPPGCGGPGCAYVAPGLYGMAWGSASYGMVRNYTEFTSSYCPGYAYGYPPASFLPGPYGAGLWRPGSAAASGFPLSHGQYRTFAVPPAPGPPPPVGVYAPFLGPPFLIGR